jgi:radical SAM superfamily enzyme YgiQ (UPF0313 family)
MRPYRLHLIAPTTDAHVYEFVECFTMPPISLLTLAALTPDHYDIRVMDETVERLVPGPCDLAAISVMYFTAEKAYAVADWYRQRNIPVIMGGCHATLCPDEVLQHCDAVVIGEADDVWRDILADFENKRLQPIYRPSVKPDLARLPPPRWDLIDKTKYDLQNLVQAGRGCSFGCDFCAIPLLNGRKSRHKAVAQVVAEISASIDTSRGLTKRVVFFSDDNIVNNPGYAKELFRALVPLGITWSSQCALSIAYDDELLDLAQASGCRGLFIGFETLQQNALNGVHKRYDASQYSQYIRKIKDRGISILGSFLFGLDTDTADAFKDTVAFCMTNNIDFVNFHLVSPTPGTPFFQRLEAEQRLLHRRWAYYQENVAYRPKAMSIRDLQDGQIQAYEEYLSYRNIFRRVVRRDLPLGQRVINLALNARFRRKLFAGIRFQREFLTYYNRQVLGI